MLRDEVKELKYNGQLVDQQGACRFCGQIQMMQAPSSWTDEMLDELATETCKCGEAEVYSSRKCKLEKAEKKIEKVFSATGIELTEATRDLMKKAAKLVLKHEIDQITVRDEEVSAVITMNNKGAVLIKASRRLELNEEV